MRIVLDTNVLISALISRGKSYSLVTSLLASIHTVVLSRPMIEEFVKISSETRIRRYVGDEDVASFLRTILSKSVVVEIASSFQVLKNSDDLILRTAYDGRAEIIVTGDGHLLGLRRFRGIKILSVSELSSILANS